MGYCTKGQKRLRISKVMELIRDGYRREQIYQIVTTPEFMNKFPGGHWEISMHTLDKYKAEAHTLLKAAAVYDAVEELGRARSRMDDLYLKSKNVKDKLAVAKELHELQGLKELKISLGGQVKTLSHITVEIVRPKAGNGAGNGDGEENKDNGGENEKD